MWYTAGANNKGHAMADDPTPIPNISIERNVRRLIDVLVSLQGSAPTEILRREFEQASGLARQMFYSTLRLARERGWIVGDGGRKKHNILNPDGSWQPSPLSSTGERLERDRFEYVKNAQALRIEELEGEVQRLLDWSGGNANRANVAISALVRAVGDSEVSTPRRLKAAAAILGYKVEDEAVSAFAIKFLEALCASSDTDIDHRIEAGRLLQQFRSPKILQPIERPVRPGSVETEETRAERRQQQAEVFRRRVEHMERVRAQNAAELERERAAGLIPGYVSDAT
jgi:hypothetical protein